MNNTVEKWHFWISQGKEATVYRWGEQMYKLLMSNFLMDLTHQKSLKSVIFDRVIRKIKVEVFGTQCIWKKAVTKTLTVCDIEYIAITNDLERPRSYFENLCSLMYIGKFSIQIRTDETEIAGYNFSGRVKIKNNLLVRSFCNGRPTE